MWTGMKWKSALILVGVVIAVSCDKNQLEPTAAERLAADVAKIDKYLADNNITAVSHVSGMRWVIHAEGTGAKVTTNDCIRIDYSGWLLGNEVAFETGTGFATTMSNSTSQPLILGWRIGLKELRKGGSITLYIPSSLAYGASERKNNGEVIIPSYSVLVFDVTILNITGYNAAGQYCYPWPS